MYTIIDNARLHINGRDILIGYVVLHEEKEQIMEFEEVEQLFKEFLVYDSLQMAMMDALSKYAPIDRPGRMCLQIENSTVLRPTKLSEYTKLIPILKKRDFNVDNLILDQIENDKPVDVKKDTYAVVNHLVSSFPEYELKAGQDVLLLEKQGDLLKISVLNDCRELLVDHSVLSPSNH